MRNNEPTAFAKVLPWLLVTSGILICLFFAPLVRLMFPVWELDQLGPGDGKKIPYALHHLQSPKSLVRQYAVRGLGQIGTEAREATPDLIKALDDESWGVASDAAWALGQIKNPTQPVINGLIKSLDHEHREVRRYAAYSLSLYGYRGRSAIPRLKSLLSDEHMGFTAAKALGEMGAGSREAIGADGIQTLTDMLCSENIGDRIEAAIALGKLGPLSAATLIELEKAANDKDKHVRQWASKALTQARAASGVTKGRWSQSQVGR